MLVSMKAPWWFAKGSSKGHQAHPRLPYPAKMFFLIQNIIPFCLHMSGSLQTNMALFSNTRHSVDIIVCCYGNSVISQQTLKRRG